MCHLYTIKCPSCQSFGTTVIAHCKNGIQPAKSGVCVAACPLNREVLLEAIEIEALTRCGVCMLNYPQEETEESQSPKLPLQEDLAVAEPLIANTHAFNKQAKKLKPKKLTLTSDADIAILQRAAQVLEATLLGLVRDKSEDSQLRKLAKGCWTKYYKDISLQYQLVSLITIYNHVADHENSRTRPPFQAFHIPSLSSYPPDFPSVLKEELNAGSSCTICQDPYSDPVKTPCGHVFCRGCIKTWVISEKKYKCPDCRARFSKSNLRLVDELLEERNRIVPKWLGLLRLKSTDDGEEGVGRGLVHEWFREYSFPFYFRYEWL